MFVCLFLPFYRSTKLVIIERLLLLAERYVITIEVKPEFGSDFLVCKLLSAASSVKMSTDPL